MDSKPTYQELEIQNAKSKPYNENKRLNPSDQDEHIYHDLIDNMSEGFAHCEMVHENNEPVDFVYLEVNKAFEKLTGLKDVVGKAVSELIPNHRTENSELFHLYTRVSQTGRPEKIVTFVESLGIWFSISVYSSKKNQFLVIFNNITTRKQWEKALKESEARFKQLIKNSFDMIILIDSEGVQHFISESCEKILGFKPEELIGISVIEKMIHPQDQELARKGLLDIIDNKASGGTQYRHLHKNGTWVNLEAYGNNQLDNPDIKSIILNVRDVTERKQAVQIIKENELKLRELNATKDKLFSIIAHDLRSPFTGILGLSGLLIENIKDLEIEEFEKYLGAINSSAQNTLVLLENLLNWAKPQSGRIAFQPQQLILASIISESIELSQAVAMEKGISLAHKEADDMEAYADKEMLKIVLRNLISNAIKFSKSGGNISILSKKEQNQVEIAVSDNGVGMSEETISKLFSIETNHTTMGTADEKGSGLGLILCKELLEKQGGKIWVESELGKGSIFKFSLPLNKSNERNNS